VQGYDDVDGVLAFGPTNLTEWTVTCARGAHADRLC
jgi:hypothetical protein